LQKDPSQRVDWPKLADHPFLTAQVPVSEQSAHDILELGYNAADIPNEVILPLLQMFEASEQTPKLEAAGAAPIIMGARIEARDVYDDMDKLNGLSGEELRNAALKIPLVNVISKLEQEANPVVAIGMLRKVRMVMRVFHATETELPPGFVRKLLNAALKPRSPFVACEWTATLLITLRSPTKAFLSDDMPSTNSIVQVVDVLVASLPSLGPEHMQSSDFIECAILLDAEGKVKLSECPFPLPVWTPYLRTYWLLPGSEPLFGQSETLHRFAHHGFLLRVLCALSKLFSSRAPLAVEARKIILQALDALDKKVGGVGPRQFHNNSLYWATRASHIALVQYFIRPELFQCDYTETLAEFVPLLSTLAPDLIQSLLAPRRFSKQSDDLLVERIQPEPTLLVSTTPRNVSLAVHLLYILVKYSKGTSALEGIFRPEVVKLIAERGIHVLLLPFYTSKMLLKTSGDGNLAHDLKTARGEKMSLRAWSIAHDGEYQVEDAQYETALIIRLLVTLNRRLPQLKVLDVLFSIPHFSVNYAMSLAYQISDSWNPSVLDENELKSWEMPLETPSVLASQTSIMMLFIEVLRDSTCSPHRLTVAAHFSLPTVIPGLVATIFTLLRSPSSVDLDWMTLGTNSFRALDHPIAIAHALVILSVQEEAEATKKNLAWIFTPVSDFLAKSDLLDDDEKSAWINNTFWDVLIEVFGNVASHADLTRGPLSPTSLLLLLHILSVGIQFCDSASASKILDQASKVLLMTQHLRTIPLSSLLECPLLQQVDIAGRALDPATGSYTIVRETVGELVSLLVAALQRPDRQGVLENFFHSETAPNLLRALAVLSDAPGYSQSCPTPIDSLDAKAWLRLHSVVTKGMNVLANVAIAVGDVQRQLIQLQTIPHLCSSKFWSQIPYLSSGVRAASPLPSIIMILTQLIKSDPDTANLILEADVVGVIKECVYTSQDVLTQSRALNLLGQFCKATPEVYRKLVQDVDASTETGATPITKWLITSLSTADLAIRRSAAFVIANALFHSADLVLHLLGSIQPLVTILNDSASFDLKTQSNAAGALGNFVRHTGVAVDRIVQSGALDVLMQLVLKTLSQTQNVDAQTVTDRLNLVRTAIFTLGNLASYPRGAEVLNARLCQHKLEPVMTILTREGLYQDQIAARHLRRLFDKLGNV